MLGDILFTIAALGFTYSAVPQILLLHRIRDSTGISLTRHWIVLGCILVTIAACIYTKVWLATIMNFVQLGFLIYLIWQIKEYRHLHWRK